MFNKHKTQKRFLLFSENFVSSYYLTKVLLFHETNSIYDIKTLQESGVEDKTALCCLVALHLKLLFAYVAQR